MCDREQRGLLIAATSRIRRKGGIWFVPSQSGNGKYTVCPDQDNPHCSCPDHETRGIKCKHIFAVEYVVRREEDEDGNVTELETLTIKRATYTQNWPAYNAAQVNEKPEFQTLLHALCQGIEEPPAGRGRPRIPMSDAIFAAVFKVYSTVSGRRFMSDLADSHGKGFIGRLPSYNSIFNILESETTFEVLRSLIVESAAPLKSIESTFACDSSGFSGSRFDRWYDHKFNQRVIKRAWCKAHIMCGVKTNIITAVEIHGQAAGDSPLLPPMLAMTQERFQVTEVLADMGYTSKSNLETIEAAGATPLIPFKKNAVAGTGVWAKMFHYFNFHREEFLSRYHQRSNVESTFSMVKAKFGDSVRSKLDVSMKNEVLAKLLCHNICCLISAVYELGVKPTFWAESALAQKVS